LISLPFTQASRLPVAGPVMAPPGEARTDAWIVSSLARALGLPGLRWRLGRWDLDRWLPRPRQGLPLPRVRPGRWLRTHRLQLWDERVADELRRLAATPVAPAEGFTLIGRRRRLGHNSWLHGGQRTGAPEAVAWLGPRDLAALGVQPGESITIESEVATYQFELPFGPIEVTGEANPITGAPIMADITLAASITDVDAWCGTVDGDVLSPIQVPLAGSTFGAIRLADRDERPGEGQFPLACS
ncbi:MAG: hypothetical protein KDK70_42980, partial [Myxococcales bacterium]|nr:hypothetical protein [Myxococcales bacterium]